MAGLPSPVGSKGTADFYGAAARQPATVTQRPAEAPPQRSEQPREGAHARRTVSGQPRRSSCHQRLRVKQTATESNKLVAMMQAQAMSALAQVAELKDRLIKEQYKAQAAESRADAAERQLERVQSHLSDNERYTLEQEAKAAASRLRGTESRPSSPQDQRAVKRQAHSTSPKPVFPARIRSATPEENELMLLLEAARADRLELQQENSRLAADNERLARAGIKVSEELRSAVAQLEKLGVRNFDEAVTKTRQLQEITKRPSQQPRHADKTPTATAGSNLGAELQAALQATNARMASRHAELQGRLALPKSPTPATAPLADYAQLRAVAAEREEFRKSATARKQRQRLEREDAEPPRRRCRSLDDEASAQHMLVGPVTVRAQQLPTVRNNQASTAQEMRQALKATDAVLRPAIRA